MSEKYEVTGIDGTDSFIRKTFTSKQAGYDFLAKMFDDAHYTCDERASIEEQGDGYCYQDEYGTRVVLRRSEQ